MRPYVICHMCTTIDGKILVSRWGRLAPAVAKHAQWLAVLGIVAAVAANGAAGITAIAPARLQATPPVMAPVTADAPASFGYKVNWFAVKAPDPVAVLRTLAAAGSTPANWRTGIAAAYEYDLSKPQSDPPRVFVTAPVDGWVFVIGARLPLPNHLDTVDPAGRLDARRFDALFGTLSREYPDVQFFTTNRIVGLNGWARARHGHVERIFCIADGEVYANDGPQTAEERHLKMLDLSGLSPAAARDAIFAEEERRAAEKDRRDAIPDEEDTMAVAGQWSVNPSLLEQRKLPPSSGYIALLSRF